MPIPKLIVAAALMAAQVAIGMTRKIEGPRLDSLKTTTAEYGTPINRFWGIRKFEVPLIWAEKLREEKKTGKGKGGKATQYKYYGTWAVLICDHEIEAVSRIWMDDKLVFDRTRPGPVTPALVAAYVVRHLIGRDPPVKLNSRNMRVYLGTEDQQPDRRMEAWCEDNIGADSCPAYRGSAYIVFEELPLEKFGNRIPNITIEAVSAAVDTYPKETMPGIISSGSSYSFASAPNSQWLLRWVNNVMEWWDLPSRTFIGRTDADDFASTVTINKAMAADGKTYWFGHVLSGADALPRLMVAEPMGAITAFGTDSDDSIPGPTRVFDTATGTRVLTAVDTGGYLDFATKIDSDVETARDFCIDGNGDLWALFHPFGSSDLLIIRSLSDATEFEVTGLVTRSGPGAARICHAADAAHFFVISDGKFYLIDDTTGAIKASGASLWSSRDVLPNASTDANTFWDGFVEYSLATGAVARTIDYSLWGAGGTSPGQTYDPISNAIIASGGTSLTWRYLDRVSSDGVSLRTVVDDVSEWCGLTGQDTLALTQTVRGYSVTQGSGKDMLGPLLDMHDVDARPHDFTVQFVNRGGAPSGILLTQDFVREGDSARYTVTIQQDTDIPKEISAKFADVDHDQQVNTAIAQRPLDATDSKRTEELDLSTLADTADGAQQKLDRFFRRMWNSRERIKLSLTAQHLALEPGDVTTPSLDGLVRNARLDKLTIRGSVLDCEFIRDETSFAALNTASGAPIEGSDTDAIVVPSATKGFALDIPLVQDADADINPLIYVAAGPYTGTWPGALAYEDETLVASIESDTKASWGYATSALKTANPNLWDRGNTVNVTVFGTLVSSTEAAIDADPTINLCALGVNGRWELLNFATATLTGTSGAGNLYTLSGLKRGRRGTEGNVGNHALADSLVMLNMAYVVERGSDDIGDSLSFRVQTIGRDPDSAPAIDLTFTGATLKPYAPARIRWTTDGTDMFGEIIRRTRVGGAWNGGSTIPLAENSEAYEVEIYSGSTLKRTISVTGNTFTYAAADIAADGGTVGTAPTVKVYQLSDAVGRGFALAA